MTDTATSRYGARQQSQGSNTNTWGDDKLNEALRLFDRGSKGVQSIAMTGDQTLSWTNYIATNTGQCAVLVLTGSLSSAANLIVPSVEWQWNVIKNSTGQTITFKTSAGAGVAIPNGRQVSVYCDATDCYFGAPNYIGADITETNNRDLMDKLAVETAIATAALPATAGTVLVSATDTTAGYLGAKVNVTGTGAATATQSTTNPGANEVTTFTVAVGALGLTDGGTKTAGFTAAVNTRYACNFTAAATIVLPTSATAQDVIGFAFGGGQLVTYDPNGLNLTVNGVPTMSTTTMGTLTSTELLTYTGATNGWT